MDQIITAALPALIALIGTIFIAIYNLRSPVQSEILKNELLDFYVPLHKLLKSEFKNDTTVTPASLDIYLQQITILFNDHYVLIPPSLVELLNQISVLDSEEFDKKKMLFKDFCKLVDINYNYCRKTLGYPCKKVYGEYRYLDASTRPVFQRNFFANVLTVAWFIYLPIMMFENRGDYFFLREFGVGFHGILVGISWVSPAIFLAWLILKLRKQ